jgi:hypothetical protein
MRIRQKIHDLNYLDYNRKQRMKKRFILFIDFKQAFDSVKIVRLVSKLQGKGVREEVLNVLIKLMNSSRVSVNNKDIINVNSGVGQGKLCSPMQFDVYIDDLLNISEDKCYTTLAFADDTAFMCTDRANLLLIMQTIKEWADENEIEINKKKSGIMIINDDGKDPSDIKGYPVVSEYKYLGVMLDSKMSPITHIANVRKHINTYLKRNRYLYKKQFTPMSLLRLIDYFVKSRLSYGMCCFLDNKRAMKDLQRTLLVHLKSILGLPTNTSHDRLQATFGEPDLKLRLAVRLLKNWYKYYDHYEEYPTIYEDTLLKYFSKDELFLSPEDREDKKIFSQLKRKLIDQNIREKFPDFNVRNEHCEFLKKKIFCHPDKRDFLIIRFFTHATVATNERLFPKCKCGEDNTPRHSTDECELDYIDRKKYLKRFNEIYKEMGLNMKESIFDYLHSIYFELDSRKRKQQTKLISMMKDVICAIIFATGTGNRNKDEGEADEEDITGECINETDNVGVNK